MRGVSPRAYRQDMTTPPAAARCFGDGDALYEAYHDHEWAVDLADSPDERELFERLSLEAFQSGLAWITILRKRDGFRAAFADFDPAVSAYVGQETSPRLSQAALETLAVIAYKQPISRGQVAAVRAVNVDSVVRTLLNRGLIQEADIDPDTGATRFETTPQFLSALGINELSDLPPVSPLLPDGQEGFDVP